MQLEYANDVEPVRAASWHDLLRTDRMSRDGVTQQLMSEAGYLDGSKGLWLTFYSNPARVLNDIDVRLQTGKTDCILIDDEGYLTRKEATAKLQRAQLSSCQCPCIS
jgi:hypothetical protein